LLHRSSRHVPCVEDGIRALDRALISAKEKQFVFDNRPAQHTTELIALQRIALCGEEVSRVQRTVAQKLERVSMKLIRTRLRHRVNSSAGMKTVLRLQNAGLDFEFLQRVRERQRQREAVVRI